MAVKDEKGNNPANLDKFPVGMRVLAVDDDRTCLKILETLLKKCHYHVTSTDQSVEALKMLRENKNNYDLVISDVNMPDMDGFELLELVGLEMDLPVIMLSAYSDRDLVYKGVTHGAVDYLLKPVRIEELRNIWQHVIRKQKLHPKDPKRSPDQEDKPREDAGDGGRGLASSGSADQNCKADRKRKDQDEDEEEESEDNNNTGYQKRPRLIWSKELQEKFLEAVNQLGLEKAVPKKILELMNVEGLTRENVASRLQKYRLCLKRVDQMKPQQVNMGTAALGGKDSSHFWMATQDGFGDLHTLSGPRRSYPPTSTLGRLNSPSPSPLTLRGMSSSGLLQPGHSRNLGCSVNTVGVQQVLLPPSHSTNVFHGFPSSMDPNQMHGKSNSHIGHIGEFSYNNFNNTVSGSSNSPHLMLQQNQSRGALTTQSSLGMPSLNHVPFGSFPLDSTVEFQGHTGLMDNVVQNPNYNSSQQWHEHSQDLDPNYVNSFNTISSLVSGSGASRSLDVRKKQEAPVVGWSNNVNASIFQQGEGQRSGLDMKMRSNADYLLEPAKSQNGYGQNNYDSLDEILGTMIKRQEQNEGMGIDGEFGCDAYPL